MLISSTVKMPTYLTIKLSGNLDLAGVEQIEMEFVNLIDNSCHIIVDLAEVDFIASMGIRMLLSAAKKLHPKELKLVLAAPNEMVKEALQITNIGAIMPCFDSLAEAEAAL